MRQRTLAGGDEQLRGVVLTKRGGSVGEQAQAPHEARQADLDPHHPTGLQTRLGVRTPEGQPRHGLHGEREGSFPEGKAAVPGIDAELPRPAPVLDAEQPLTTWRHLQAGLGQRPAVGYAGRGELEPDQAVAARPDRADLDRGAFEAPAAQVQRSPVQPELQLRQPIAEPLDPLGSRQHASFRKVPP